MKTLGAMLGLGAMLVAGSAHATTIYDTMTVNIGSNHVNDFSQATVGSPLGNSFSVYGPTHVTSLGFQLFDLNASTDIGSVLVFLVPNDPITNLSTTSITNTSGSNGNSQVGALYLEASRTPQCKQPMVTLTTLPVDFTIGAGRYWIELIGSTDISNGGTGGADLGITSQLARWGFNGGTANTIGTAGEFSSVGTFPVNGTNVTQQFVNSATEGNFEMTIDTSPIPEPASLAILGISLMGLSVAHRRRAKNLAT